MTTKHVLIIGATSAVAQGVAQRFAAQDATIFCLARQPEKMAVAAAALGEAFAGSFCYDFNQTERAAEAIATAVATLGHIDIALIAHGALFDQVESEHSFAMAKATLDTNLSSVVSFLIPLSAQMEKQGSGKIGVITSVAGERGRPRNFTYGAAKGALNIYLQGLRSRFWHSGVEIYTFKLGPVDTPMTIEHPKNASFATVDQVADAIVKAFQKKRYQRYVPGYWAFIMFAVRHLPEWLFQRLTFLSGR
jgi:short-subunit dehydrogenase